MQHRSLHWNIIDRIAPAETVAFVDNINNTVPIESVLHAPANGNVNWTD